MPTKKKKIKHSRTGKILTATLYCYVEPGNLKHAKSEGGKPKYGTVSAYVNALIAKDRGVAPATGTKKQVLAGESKGKSIRKKTKSSSNVTATKSVSQISSATSILRKLQAKARKAHKPIPKKLTSSQFSGARA